MQLLPTQRPLFDIPAEIAYLNCAYYSPQPNCVRDALIEGAAHKSRPWLVTSDQFFDEVEQLRLLLAATLGGNSEGYAIVPSATYGVATAVRAIEPSLSAGDELLIFAEEFPSLYLPLDRAARQTGARVVTAPADTASLTDSIIDRIGPRTRIVATGACHWTDGRPVDLHRVSAAAKSVGAALLVDASQSLGASPFDFNGIDPDFVAAAGYKWLLCPYGFGLLYVAERWWQARPLEESWLARTRSEDFANLVEYSDVYKDGARRFDVSEACRATVTRGAVAATALLQQWGVANISATLQRLTGQIVDVLDASGHFLPVEAGRVPHILAARLPGDNARAIMERLKAHGVIISQRGRALRFSPHLHFDASDLNILAGALS